MSRGRQIALAYACLILGFLGPILSPGVSIGDGWLLIGLGALGGAFAFWRELASLIGVTLENGLTGVYIKEARQEFREISRQQTKNEDGTVTTHILGEIPTPVARITFSVTDPNGLALNVSEGPTPGATGHSSVIIGVYRDPNPESLMQSFGPAQGRYIVSVRTKDDTPVALGITIG
jgi:hypothetical protein